MQDVIAPEFSRNKGFHNSVYARVLESIIDCCALCEQPLHHIPPEHKEIQVHAPKALL